MMLTVRMLPVGPLGANCCLVTDETRRALLVDPGEPDDDVAQALAGLELVAVVCTHGHYDHIGGVDTFCAGGAPLFIGRGDAACLADPELNGSAWFGLPLVVETAPSRLLADGDGITLGDEVLRVVGLPGHSPGGIGLVHLPADGEPGFVIAGDQLFEGSIGRADLPGGDYASLIRSIRDKLYVLPDETVVYPGHGQATTIGEEKRHNPFVRG